MMLYISLNTINEKKYKNRYDKIGMEYHPSGLCCKNDIN